MLSLLPITSHLVFTKGSTETTSLSVRSVTTDLAVTLSSFGITTVIWITLTVTLDTVDTVVGINTRFVITRFAGLFREEKVLMLRITLTETKRGMRWAKTNPFINPLSKSEIERFKRCFFFFAVRSESVTLSNLALNYRFEKTPGWYSSV